MALPFGVAEKALVAAFVGYLVCKFVGPTALLYTVLPAVILQIYIWYRQSTLWKRHGVPSQPAWMVLGHGLDYLKKGMHACDVEWTNKFGKIYGAYFFTQAEIVISDEELLKQILVKDFNNFTNRRGNEVSKETIFSRVLTSLKNDEWKSTRSVITPAFTSGKLRSTVHLIENCVNTLCSILDEQNDYENGADVKHIMGNMATEVIAAAAFAMDIDAQRNPDNAFSHHAKSVFSANFAFRRVITQVCFPWFTRTLRDVFKVPLFNRFEEFYVQNLQAVIKNRRQNPLIEKPDFLQLLINAVDSHQKGDYPAEEKDSVIDHGIKSTKKWTMNDRDIIAQSVIFLLAGFETTATTLTYASYLLAWHPDIQEQCYKELEKIVPAADEPLTYAHIQQGVPYLDAVICETLRIFPPAVRFDRVCENDYQLTDTISIPKGAVVVVPVYAIHHSVENYEDPEKFDPERLVIYFAHKKVHFRFLLAEKKPSNPFAYVPFGYGPRNCIGMRFAQLEMKLALGNVLRKFRIETCSKTEPMPLQLSGAALLKPKNPIRVNFKRRQ